jgi:GT2 family glycosyltransferase
MPDRIVLPAAPSPLVSVIIPVTVPAIAGTTAPDLLLAGLRALERHGPRDIPFETIAVLNGGARDYEALVQAVDGLRIESSPANFGLAGAGHRGRALARGELLVLLHDDAEITPGWLEALVAAARRHPEAGAIGGKVLFPDGRLQSAGMILWRNATTSPPWSGASPPASAFDTPRPVDYCGTSSLLIRAATWDAVGGFDERFFPVYFVDVDLAMAIRQLGQSVLYEPRSVIRHHQGASGNLRFRRFVTDRNRRRFLAKWQSALESHEPWDGGSPASIERALARAGRVSQRGTPPESRDRPPCDAAGQERRYLEMELELHKAYGEHLAEHLEQHLEERMAERIAAGQAEITELRARSAALETVEKSRWWRLYQRLLPVLRLLR